MSSLLIEGLDDSCIKNIQNISEFIGVGSNDLLVLAMQNIPSLDNPNTKRILHKISSMVKEDIETRNSKHLISHILKCYPVMHYEGIMAHVVLNLQSCWDILCDIFYDSESTEFDEPPISLQLHCIKDI